MNNYIQIKNYIIIILVSFSLFLVSCKSKKTNYDNYPKALAELCKKIDNNPKESKLYYERAQYYYQTGNINKGFEDITTAIKLDPNQSKYYVSLSDFYFAKQETDLTEESLQKAIQLDNKNNEARLKLAELYFHLRMLAECNKTIDEAINLQPHNPKALLIRAFCLKEVGDTTGMLRMLQLVIDQNPKEKKANLELGYYYQTQGNPLAVSYYQNALQYDPTDKEINYNLAKMFQDLGEIDLAIEQYNKLLSFDPDNKFVYTNIGYIYLYYEDRYEEAITYFNKAIEIDSTMVSAICNRGVAFELQKKYDLARQDFMHCKQIKHDFEPAITGLNRLDKLKK